MSSPKPRRRANLWCTFLGDLLSCPQHRQKKVSSLVTSSCGDFFQVHTLTRVQPLTHPNDPLTLAQGLALGSLPTWTKCSKLAFGLRSVQQSQVTRASVPLHLRASAFRFPSGSGAYSCSVHCRRAGVTWHAFFKCFVEDHAIWHQASKGSWTSAFYSIKLRCWIRWILNCNSHHSVSHSVSIKRQLCPGHMVQNAKIMAFMAGWEDRVRDGNAILGLGRGRHTGLGQGRMYEAKWGGGWVKVTLGGRRRGRLLLEWRTGLQIERGAEQKDREENRHGRNKNGRSQRSGLVLTISYKGDLIDLWKPRL